jgi:hypothetical protein
MNFIKLISVFVITDPQNITFKFVQVQRNATACGSICAKHSNDAVILTCLALCALVLWHPMNYFDAVVISLPTSRAAA